MTVRCPSLPVMVKYELIQLSFSKTVIYNDTCMQNKAKPRAMSKRKNIIHHGLKCSDEFKDTGWKVKSACRAGAMLTIYSQGLRPR